MCIVPIVCPNTFYCKLFHAIFCSVFLEGFGGRGGGGGGGGNRWNNDDSRSYQRDGNRDR